MHTIRNAFAYSNMTYVRKNSAVRARYRKLRSAILSGYLAKYKTKKDYTKPPSGRKSAPGGDASRSRQMTYSLVPPKPGNHARWRAHDGRFPTFDEHQATGGKRSGVVGAMHSDFSFR